MDYTLHDLCDAFPDAIRQTPNARAIFKRKSQPFIPDEFQEVTDLWLSFREGDTRYLQYSMTRREWIFLGFSNDLRFYPDPKIFFPYGLDDLDEAIATLNVDIWAGIILRYRDLPDHRKNDPAYREWQERMGGHRFNTTPEIRKWLKERILHDIHDIPEEMVLWRIDELSRMYAFGHIRPYAGRYNPYLETSTYHIKGLWGSSHRYGKEVCL